MSLHLSSIDAICCSHWTGFSWKLLLKSLESFVHLGSSYLVLYANRGWASQRSQRTSGSLTSTGDPCRPNWEGWKTPSCTIAKVCDPEVNPSQSVNQSINQWDLQIFTAPVLNVFARCLMFVQRTYFNPFSIPFTHDRQCKHVIHRG